MGLFHFIWPSLVKYKWKFLLLTFLILSWSFENSVIPLILGKIVDGFVLCSERKLETWNTIGANIIFYVGLWAFVHFCCRIGDFIRASLFPKFASDIRMRAFEEVNKKSHSYFVNHLSGDISSKVSMFQEKLTNLLMISIHLLLPSVVSLCFACRFLNSVKTEISIALCFWLLLHMLICVILGGKCSKYEELHSSANNLLSGRIVDSVTNHFSWRLFTNEKFEYKNISQYQKQEVITAQKSQKYIAKLYTFLSIFSVILNVCGINALGYYYWQLGDISIGDFVFVINTTLGIERLAWAVGLQLPTIFADIGACKQAFSVIAEESYIKDIPNANKLVVSGGEIVLKDVSFSYNSELFFKNLSVEIRPKEKIGLVGRSGNGKTTFCNLILRLYDIKSGKILIDNHDITEVTQESLRQSISVVPQDPALFHRSILENIKYGNIDAPPEKVNEAVEKAYITDLIEDVGVDFDVGEGGSKLSKGQRQSIAIARAILKDAPILFLDEATSALDSISEKAIQKSLNKAIEGKTVLAIAHRLSTLKHMDRIFVFDKGKIAEIGTHEELLKNKGIYYALWQAQVNGFIGG